MDPPFPDGRQAVSYTNGSLPGSEQQSGRVLGASVPETLYTLTSSVFRAPKQHQPETGSLPQGAGDPSQIQQLVSQSRGCGSRDPMTIYQSQRSMNQLILPSLAPTTAGLEYAVYSDPSSGAVAFPYNPSPVSTGAWPSPTQPFPPPPMKILESQQNYPETLQIRTPTSIDDSQHSGYEISRVYWPTAHSTDHASVGSRPPHPSPVSLESHSPVAVTSVAVSPATSVTLVGSSAKMDFGRPSFRLGSNSLEASSMSRESSQISGKGGSKNNAKKDEPYAKLIEKALRSRPDHSMQLQEIYQWFIDNTDKARGYQSQPKEGKGWQNSIRHNLSMNAAFTKKDEDRTGGSMLASDTKRSTVWVLAPWAARDGVQSTTRYRKANSSKKSSAARSASHPYNLNLRPGAASRIVPSQSYDNKTVVSRLLSHPGYPNYPYTTGMPASPTAAGMLPQRAMSMRRTTSGSYPSEVYTLPRIDTGVFSHVKREHNHGGFSQSAHSHQPYDTVLPDPSMPSNIAATSSQTGAYTGSMGHQNPVHYGMSQPSFPYSVQDVHVQYPNNPHAMAATGQTAMFDHESGGVYEFEGGGI